ncbi:MAG: HAD family hydrolase [Actinobacteria bacterium HGW-Actinobacteria-5]|jgi:hypothetical protein|nr:MAG: HAD family hydrolase [Actinobacteria bacterium HGW-Actinobacteria-5]
MQDDSNWTEQMHRIASARLVVADMDGTLLTVAGQLPDGLWSTLARLRRAGIVFAVASGRQYPTLRSYFDPAPEGVAYIAENGGYAVHAGVEISARPLPLPVARKAALNVRTAARSHDIGAVWCARDVAYAERRDAPFLREVTAFYRSLELVDDLTRITDEAIKMAVYDFGDAERGSARLLQPLSSPAQLVVSTPHWLDIMNPEANKGVALRDLQAALGVTPEETIVFGDYPNDLELMEAATHSFAMANAHPEVLRRARYLAPSNEDRGVLVVLDAVLDTIS